MCIEVARIPPSISFRNFPLTKLILLLVILANADVKIYLSIIASPITKTFFIYFLKII